MKSILKVIICFSIFVAFSCSFDNQSEAPEDTLNAVSLQGPTINQCTGYGLFENAQFDCGWKRGYGDWVFHYNSVVSGGNFRACESIRIGTEEEYDTITEKVVIRRVKSLFESVDNSPMIINQVQTLYADYYSDLVANENNSFFNMGQKAGYDAGKGQVPYAPNVPGADCN